LGNNGAGGLALIRLDDSPAFARLAELWVNREADPSLDLDEEMGWFSSKLPVTIGLRLKDAKAFEAFRKDWEEKGSLNGFGDLRRSRSIHRGVAINRVRPGRRSDVAKEAKEASRRYGTKVSPAIYHTTIDGHWYASLSEAPLKDVIDYHLALQGKAAKKPATVEINESLYLAPRAAVKARDALSYYLEWETHRRALVNGPIWYTLYRSGVITESAPDKARQEAARRYLGFVPASPDGAAYAYDARTGEVLNRRHGSLRQPHRHRGLDAASPLARILEQFPTLRADLRFREDGLYTVLTMERDGGKR
jgi:hypothetical protein